MTRTPDILCIGALLWDVIGHAVVPLYPGADVPGRITRSPGGVAGNIAAALARHGLHPAILGAVGADAEGTELLAATEARGIDTAHVLRLAGRATDRYLAIEGPDGLMSAVADAGALESAGDDILTPLADGRLGSATAPWAGPVCIDGNLTDAVLEGIAASPLFARARLHVASAGPGKAGRLAPFLSHPSATLHVNRDEAARLCTTPFADAAEAALGLTARGAARAVVTDGAQMVADARGGDVVTALPPSTAVARVTGAGDAFMAAHVAACLRGAPRDAALAAALAAATAHISPEIAP
ncbi:MAG: kinase [Rubellimicrobium sp.]|nr:kinase [Rubellimicrobium sp.]